MNIHALYPEQADEYRMEIWFRQEALIDQFKRLTRKATASLQLFDHPPIPPKVEYRYEIGTEEIEEEEELENEGRTDQRIQVTLVDDEKLSIHIVELDDDSWCAEAIVHFGKRKKKLEIFGKTKALVTHKIIHEASAIRARAYARLNS